MVNFWSILLVFMALNFGMFGFSDLYAEESIVVYSGPTERLIKPVLDHFQQTTGTTVQLLTAGSTELVKPVTCEGSPVPC